jgi:hypothetical protein
LFDSIGQTPFRNIPATQGFESVPRFDPSKAATVALCKSTGFSTRYTFLQRFESLNFLQSVLEDSGVILCAILRITCNEWLDQVSMMEQLTRNESSQMNSVIDVGDYAIEMDLKCGEYLRENEEMMRGCLEVIQQPETLLSDASRRSPNSDEKVRQTLSDLDLDFQELLRATEDHIKRLGSRYAISASILTIQESRKAIKQAEDIGYKLFSSRISNPLSSL